MMSNYTYTYEYQIVAIQNSEDYEGKGCSELLDRSAARTHMNQSGLQFGTPPVRTRKKVACIKK